LALGVSSTYTAWLFLIAAGGEEGVENYIELLKIEMQMLTSASAFERCQCGRCYVSGQRSCGGAGSTPRLQLASVCRWFRP